MTAPRVLKKRIRSLRKNLQRLANVRFQNESVRAAYVQALLARGDRRVARILLHHHQKDGGWPSILKTPPIDTDFFTLRERPEDELLPWDFIDTGVSRDFLWREYRRALAAKPTRPCPPEQSCQRCRACGSQTP